MMRSPAASSSNLIKDMVEPGIRVLRCPATGGVWLRHVDYLRWKDSPQHTPPEPPPEVPPEPPADHPATDEGADIPLTDSPAGKRCPEDGYFLIRHRVGHGLGFHLDRCGHCGGVWLDAGEWESLLAHGLHENLGRIFTSAWQAEVRRQDQLKQTEHRLIGWFGEADYRELQRVRKWIDEHERSYEIRAFLNGDYD